MTMPAEERLEFAKGILAGLGAPETEENLEILLSWMHAEGTAARFNPMATTYTNPNITSTPLPGNTAGVQEYQSWAEGVVATTQTLLLDHYTRIVELLREGSTDIATFNADPLVSEELGTWSGYAEAVEGDPFRGIEGTPETGYLALPVGAVPVTGSTEADAIVIPDSVGMGQPEYVRSEVPHEFADTLGIPGGYELIQLVGADKYLVYTVTDPNMQGAATAHVYFRIRPDDPQFDAFGPPTESVTAAVWDQRQAEYLRGGVWSTLQSADYAGRDWQQIVDWAFDATHYGGTLALADVDIMQAIAALIVDPTLDLSEGGDFENLIRGSAWWESHTSAEDTWNDMKAVDKERMIGQKAVELAATFEYYTGQPIDTSSWFPADGTAVNVELLQNYSNLEGTQDFYGLAFSVLTGRLSDPEIVASIIKPLASDADLYPNSPHLRRLEDEERQTGARASLVGQWQAEVRKMYEAQGIQPTQGQIDNWAEPLYMNTKTIDEAQEAIEATGLATWPHKPVGLDWKTWADPYTAAYANILELAEPTFTNDDLRTALGNVEQAPNLHQFKQDLRRDPRWLDTKNARDSYYGTFGRIGRLMGFG